MQKYFVAELDDSDLRPPVTQRRSNDASETSASAAKPVLVKSTWTDPKTQHTYEITETAAKGPDADFSVDQKARELALQRAKTWDSPSEPRSRRYMDEPETNEPEPDANPVLMETSLRQRALREARFELSQMPSTEKPLRDDLDEDGVPFPERKFNMRGFNEETRRISAPADVLLHGVSSVSTKPRFEDTQNSQKVKPEIVHVGKDKVAFQSVFRNMMSSLVKDKVRNTSTDPSNRTEVESMIRGMLDAGLDKSWTVPENIPVPQKPDAVAITVGRRALDSISAFKNVPEISNLSNSEKDQLMLAIGRAMLNLAISPSADASKPNHKITEDAPQINDILKKKILACIEPSVVSKALGPELTSMVFKEKAMASQVRPAEGQSKAKQAPVWNQAVPKETVEGRTRALRPTSESFGARSVTFDAMTDEIERQIPIKSNSMDISFATKRLPASNLLNMFKE